MPVFILLRDFLLKFLFIAECSVNMKKKKKSYFPTFFFFADISIIKIFAKYYWYDFISKVSLWHFSWEFIFSNISRVSNQYFNYKRSRINWKMCISKKALPVWDRVNIIIFQKSACNINLNFFIGFLAKLIWDFELKWFYCIL